MTPRSRTFVDGWQKSARYVGARPCWIILNYHNIWLNYAISVEATPRFVMCKFYACVIDYSIFHYDHKNCVPAEKQWGHSGIN